MKGELRGRSRRHDRRHHQLAGTAGRRRRHSGIDRRLRRPPVVAVRHDRFVPTLAAAKHRRDRWASLVARVWSDGAVTAGDDREAGFCGMGLGGDYSVSRAAEWLATRSAQWLRKNGIVT